MRPQEVPKEVLNSFWAPSRPDRVRGRDGEERFLPPGKREKRREKKENNKDKREEGAEKREERREKTKARPKEAARGPQMRPPEVPTEGGTAQKRVGP